MNLFFKYLIKEVVIPICITVFNAMKYCFLPESSSSFDISYVFCLQFTNKNPFHVYHTTTVAKDKFKSQNMSTT